MSKPADLLVAQIPRLRRYARALVGDSGRADDLVQDCLARALARIGLWRTGSDMRAWLFTIMHNQFVNACRRQQTQLETAALTDIHVIEQCDDADLRVRLSDLQDGLQALVPEHREVLLLVSLEGMSYRQVADVLGIPQGTVMSRLHRSREQLRAWLDGERGGSSGLRSVK